MDRRTGATLNAATQRKGQQPCIYECLRVATPPIFKTGTNVCCSVTFTKLLFYKIHNSIKAKDVIHTLISTVDCDKKLDFSKRLFFGFFSLITLADI